MKMLIYRTPVIKTEEVKKILKHLAKTSLIRMSFCRYH